MVAKIDIISSLIELKIDSEEKVINLKFGVKYYFKINTWPDTEVNLNITMNNMINYPFSQVTIYELWSIGFSNPLQNYSL